MQNGKKQQISGPKNDLRTTWGPNSIELIPVIVGATGLVNNNLQKHLQTIQGSPQLEEIQLCAIKGTIEILKRTLSHQI